MVLRTANTPKEEENTMEFLRKMQENKDKEAGIYIDGERIMDPSYLVGKQFLFVGVEMWVSANDDILYKVDLTATPLLSNQNEYNN